MDNNFGDGFATSNSSISDMGIRELVAELYVCWKCYIVELELVGTCSECGGPLECVDFVPASLIREEK